MLDWTDLQNQTAPGTGSLADADDINKIAHEVINNGTAIVTLNAQMAQKQDVLTFDTAPTPGSDNPVKSDGIKTALDGKVDKVNGAGLAQILSCDVAQWGKPTEFKYNVINVKRGNGTTDSVNVYPVVKMDTLLGGKQDVLTFDTEPTANSDNPVKSGGVYTALSGKQDNVQIVDESGTVSSGQVTLTVDFATANNCDIRCYPLFDEITAIIFRKIGNPDSDLAFSLSFHTGYNAPTVTYQSSGGFSEITWIGTDCQMDSLGTSTFTPVALKQYDIMFYNNGKTIVGMVVGYDISSGNQAVSGNE